ncbi:DUF4133 domain-containing protein [Mucilaginibacter terrenus]|uniref:DUF4133 domain-containing protein n=1 Tax=Mucilaginibacter terrenus TaxID=2482727 RepID=A0A3E2NVP7_9SPHI|nr:DUF4133 domain-containing protein [Mucilaginibacter terrenus]RFZ85096.1 DUF4133 domain-containing protein [Mucilaginibacter terrenus]
MALYQINKGINKPIEFKGLKAQYIGYLAAGLVILLIGFAVMYLFSVPVTMCLLIIGALGSLLFYQVFKLSHKYGQYGLMKRSAKRYLPRYLQFTTRNVFLQLKRRS